MEFMIGVSQYYKGNGIRAVLVHKQYACVKCKHHIHKDTSLHLHIANQPGNFTYIIIDYGMHAFSIQLLIPLVLRLKLVTIIMHY